MFKHCVDNHTAQTLTTYTTLLHLVLTPTGCLCNHRASGCLYLAPLLSQLLLLLYSSSSSMG
jgi:hypothetical protein